MMNKEITAEKNKEITSAENLCRNNQKMGQGKL